MPSPRVRVLPLVALALLVGCWGTETRQAAVEEGVRDEMWQHWSEGTAVRDAVIAGDLKATHARAAALGARLPVEGLPEDAKPHEAELVRIVAALGEADDLTRAAALTGELALTCGQCHATIGAVPRDDTPMPPAVEGIEAEMKRHQWAVERMWLGLVRSDATQFDQALDALAVAPLIPSGTPADSPLPPLATELELAVHELVRQARSAPDDATRAKRFGELLVTCATCHALIRDRKR